MTLFDRATDRGIEVDQVARTGRAVTTGKGWASNKSNGAGLTNRQGMATTNRQR